ncbi:MAG: hypothetical protein ACM3XS_10600, partial [Bacteroidota bacterium]
RLFSEITAAAAGLCRDEFRVIGCERAVGEWRLLAMHLAGILLGPRAGRALAARLLRRCYPALAGLALADRDRGRG